MKTRDGEWFQAEIREIRYVDGADTPLGESPIGVDVLDAFYKLAERTWAWRAEPCGQWMVHDPANARIVFGSLRSDVLTVWTDQTFVRIPPTGLSTLGSGPA
jgi:hypothetical protein